MSAEPMEIPHAFRDFGARIAVVLGSGLASFADGVEIEAELEYADIAGHPIVGVPGHAGRYLAARLGGQPIVIADGRVHLYEGYSAREAAHPVRVLHAMGIHMIVLTNAAGTLNTNFQPGGWMMISDHINLLGESPLRGGPHFHDMGGIYSKELRAHFRAQAGELGITLHEGVYAAMPGPQYETPAEIRMLQILGADAVGMSTVPEAIQAHALGMRVAAFSCLTNWAAGLSPESLNHGEVQSAGLRAAGDMVKLLRHSLPKLS